MLICAINPELFAMVLENPGIKAGCRDGIGGVGKLQQQEMSAANLLPTNKILLSFIIRGVTVIFP